MIRRARRYDGEVPVCSDRQTEASFRQKGTLETPWDVQQPYGGR